MQKQILPSKNEIKNAIVELLSKKKRVTTKQINQYVFKKFKIDKEVYLKKTDYKITTVFDYRMCWIRTELRQQGIISNPAKGIWEICK